MSRLNCVELTVRHLDKYGNVILSEPFSVVVGLGVRVGDEVAVTAGDVTRRAVIARSFTGINEGTLILYENSYGFTELAVSVGSAQDTVNVKVRDTILVCRDN